MVFVFPFPFFSYGFSSFLEAGKKASYKMYYAEPELKTTRTGRAVACDAGSIPAYNPCHAKGQNRFIRAVYGKGLLLSRSSVCLVIPILPPHLCFFYLVRACMRMFSFFPLVLIRYRLVDRSMNHKHKPVLLTIQNSLVS